jgi:hypothetical protein
VKVEIWKMDQRFHRKSKKNLKLPSNGVNLGKTVAIGNSETRPETKKT